MPKRKWKLFGSEYVTRLHRHLFAAGTGSDEYLSREPEDNRRIAEYEQQLIAGENRIRQLEGQIANLIELKDLSSTRFPELVK